MRIILASGSPRRKELMEMLKIENMEIIPAKGEEAEHPELTASEAIARSKELLAANEKTVTEIAAELGYSSPQYFSRKFTQEVGCPPSQYAQTLLQTP